MVESLCANCQAWICAPDDAFCGHCGQPVASLRLQAYPGVLFVGHHPPSVVLQVVNPTCGTLTIQDYTKGIPWVDWTQPPQGTIGPGATINYFAKAGTRRLQEPVAVEISVQTNAGRASGVLMAIEVTPRLQATPEEIETWSGRKHLEFQIIPKAGALWILGLRDSDQPWLRVTPISEPKLVTSQEPLPITLDLDSTFWQGRHPGQSAKAAMQVEYEGPHGPAIASVEVSFAVRRPPALTWAEEHISQDLPAMGKQVLAFNLHNREGGDGGLQNGTLQIKEATLAPPPGIACPVHLRSVTAYEVLGGHKTEVEFELDLTSVPPGLYHFAMEVRSNAPEKERRFRAPIRVVGVDQYDGTIAIDFGTSNTSCALIQTGGEDRDLEAVNLDGNELTCPTLVRYLNLDGPLPEIQTGAAFKALAATDHEVAASTVSRLKQQLGEATRKLVIRPKNREEFMEREARECAADYLRFVREVAEIKARARFRRFVLTHPAVCSLRQYRNLRWAVESAFGPGLDIRFMQEPVASLIPFFNDMATPRNAPPSYAVAAFDLGGGTTDITLVSVKHEMDRNYGVTAIKPRIVTSWGERFGGEDLTDFLVEELTRRCEDVLAREHPGWSLASPTLSGAAGPDILRNRYEFMKSAEQIKTGLSEETPGYRQLNVGSLHVRVLPEDRYASPDDRTIDAEKLAMAGAAPLDRVFLAHVETNIDRLALRLKESAKLLGGPLNFIQLSGKTTFLPAVKNVLARHFPEPATRIQRARDPKQIVVNGACLAAVMEDRSLRKLVLPSSSNRTTSSVGVLNDVSGEFEPIIRLDTEIPKNGLECEGKWYRRSEVVLWENLGFETKRIRADGSRNDLIQRLGTWEAGSASIPTEGALTLRLRLEPGYTLAASLVTANGKSIPLAPRNPQGGSI